MVPQELETSPALVRPRVGAWDQRQVAGEGRQPVEQTATGIGRCGRWRI
jgi:hypothetical protein